MLPAVCADRGRPDRHHHRLLCEARSGEKHHPSYAAKSRKAGRRGGRFASTSECGDLSSRKAAKVIASARIQHINDDERERPLSLPAQPQ